MDGWLGTLDVPLFVSHRRLGKRKSLPRAHGRWALDSGGFTELNLHGRWTIAEGSYVTAVRRYQDEIGMLDWAAPMDWMCEPPVLKATGLTVHDHQKATVANFLQLQMLAPDLPFIPVLQGWERDDYLRCWQMYDAAGIDLEKEPTVGVGTVCRRQATDEAMEIFRALRPLRLHGFGVKLLGIDRYSHLLSSFDSMAWSFDARRAAPLPGHTHLNCANCPDYALLWRDRVLARLNGVHMTIASPEARDLEPQEVEALQQKSYALDQRVKTAVAQGREALWEVAQACYEFHEIRGWEVLGYEHQQDWCNDPEVGMSVTTFQRFVSNWRDLAVARQIPAADLKELDQSKVQTVLPSIKQGKVPVKQALADAKVLGRSDLVEKYVRQSEKPTEEETTAPPVNPADDVPVQADEVMTNGSTGNADDVPDDGEIVLEGTAEEVLTPEAVAEIDDRLNAYQAALAEAKACLAEEYPLRNASRQRYQKALLGLARAVDTRRHYHVGDANTEADCPACEALLKG
jgi:hypothetical protein